MVFWLRLWLRLFLAFVALVYGQSLTPGPTATSVCNLLQNQAPERIQMFGAADNSLYLMVENEVTQVPLSKEYVDSFSGKMALYPRDNDFKDLGPWPRISWLSRVASQVTTSDEIYSVNIHVNHTAHEGQPNRVIWHVLTRKEQNFLWYNDSRRELVTLTGGGDSGAPEYRVVGDGTGKRVYHLLMEPKWGGVVMVSALIGQSPWITPGTNKPKKLIQLLQAGKSVFFRYPAPSDSPDVTPLSPKLVPLLPDLTGLYGFINKGVIHLWDLKNRSVILIKDPWLRNKHLKSTRFYRLPLTEYIACSDSEWNARKSELFQKQLPLAPIQDYTWVWIFLGIALLALVLGLILHKLVWAKYGPSLSLEGRWKRSKSPRHSPDSSPNRKRSSSNRGSRSSSKKKKKKKKRTKSPSSKAHCSSASVEVQDNSVSQ